MKNIGIKVVFLLFSVGSLLAHAQGDAGSFGTYYQTGGRSAQHSFQDFAGNMIMSGGNIGFSGTARNWWNGSPKNRIPSTILYTKDNDRLLLNFGSQRFVVDNVSSGKEINMLIDRTNKKVQFTVLSEVKGIGNASPNLQNPILIDGRSLILAETAADGSPYINVDVDLDVSDITVNKHQLVG